MTESPEESSRTPAELTFLTMLLAGREWLDVWPCEDADGTPWLCVSLDLVRDNNVVKTARADFDGTRLLGGWSPGFLNWDNGVRALDAGIDVRGADGLDAAGGPAELAAEAGRWFDQHRSAWDVQVLRPGVVFPDLDPATAKRWLSAVHESARIQGGHVLAEMVEPTVDRNHYSVVLAVGAETVTLLLNTGASLVACVKGDRPFPANAEYVEVPAPDSFAQAGLAIARPEQMVELLSEGQLAGLDPHELKQVRYHRPARVGDAVFNWFD